MIDRSESVSGSAALIVWAVRVCVGLVSLRAVAIELGSTILSLEVPWSVVASVGPIRYSDISPNTGSADDLFNRSSHPGLRFRDIATEVGIKFRPRLY